MSGLVLAEAWARMSRGGQNAASDDDASPRALISIGQVRDINNDDDDGSYDASGAVTIHAQQQQNSSNTVTLKVPRRHPQGFARPPPFVVQEERRSKRREARLRMQQERDVFRRINNSRTRPAAMSVGYKEWMFIDDQNDFSSDDDTGADADDGGSGDYDATATFLNAAPDHIGQLLSRQREAAMREVEAARRLQEDTLEQQRERDRWQQEQDRREQEEAAASLARMRQNARDNSIIDASAGYNPVLPLPPPEPRPVVPGREGLLPFEEPRCAPLFGKTELEKSRDRVKALQEQLRQVQQEHQQQQQHQQQFRPPREEIDVNSQHNNHDNEDEDMPPPISTPRSRSAFRSTTTADHHHLVASRSSSSPAQPQQPQQPKLSSFQLRHLSAVSHSRQQALKVLPLLPASQREMVKCAIVEDLCATTNASVAATEKFVKRGAMITPISAIDEDA